jgi:hypothetical protein
MTKRQRDRIVAKAKTIGGCAVRRYVPEAGASPRFVAMRNGLVAAFQAQGLYIAEGLYQRNPFVHVFRRRKQ